jgi:hypothetical protein
VRMQAQAKVLGAERSDPTGGRAKLGAAAESEHCQRRKDVLREAGCRAMSNCRALFPGRRPTDDGQGNGPVQPSSAPAQGWWHQGNGWHSKAGKVSEPRGPTRKPGTGEASGGVETGGSGRSSEDAADNRTAVERRARGAAPCTRSEGRPDMPSGQRELPASSRAGTKAASNSMERKVAADASPRCLEAVLGKTRRTEF